MPFTKTKHMQMQFNINKQTLPQRSDEVVVLKPLTQSYQNFTTLNYQNSTSNKHSQQGWDSLFYSLQYKTKRNTSHESRHSDGTSLLTLYQAAFLLFSITFFSNFRVSLTYFLFIYIITTLLLSTWFIFF